MVEYVFPTLPADIRLSYPDRSSADTAHQLHHDQIHQGLLDFNASGLANADKAVDHPSASGTVSIDTSKGFHQVTLVGNVVLQLTGPGREVAILAIQDNVGGRTCTLQDAGPVQPVVAVEPGAETLFAAMQFPAGWRVTSRNVVPTEVSTPAITFSDGTNTITVPAATGLRAFLDGEELTTGAHIGYAQGVVNVTWVLKPGYVFALGATTDWPHTFPVPTNSAQTPSAIGNMNAYWDPSLGGALTLDGSSFVLSCDDVGVNDLDISKSGSGNIATTTVNAKTAILFDGPTKTMSKTSQPAGQGGNALDITMWAVVKILNVDTTSDICLEMGTQNETVGNTRAVRSPVNPSTPYLEVPQSYALNEVVLIAFTKPASGKSRLWIKGSEAPGLITQSASVHAFFGDGSGTTCQFALCAAGVVGRVLNNYEFQGLRQWAVAQWGAS